MWPTASTRLVALLGEPVAHSLSPAIQNAGFRAAGLDIAYVACRVRVGGLADALRGLRALGAVGANVTVPHKVDVAGLVDELAPAAAATGAVNTLVPIPTGWRGENTDVEGFLVPLQDRSSSLAGASVVVFGAGGAARAVTYAVLTALAPARLTVVARNPDRARRMAGDLSKHDRAGALAVGLPDRAGSWVTDARLVINASGAGMTPNEEETPWPDASAFGPHQVVYDVVYTPRITRLLRDAAKRGARTIDGTEMLLAQAAASFRLWTGYELPLEAARQAMDDSVPSG